MNELPLRVLPILFAFLMGLPATFSEAASEAVESKIKKIVMMMNIVTIEYGAAVSDGAIVNAAEYEESQIFLEQSANRFKKLPAVPEQKDKLADIVQRFETLKGKIEQKVDPNDVLSMAVAINKDILAVYGVKINEAPSTPVSLENGKQIYVSRCSVCHGMTGKGDGPIAGQLDPAPAVLADPAVTGDAETVAYDNFQVINVGIANTAMIGWADLLTEPELWDVTYYIRSFSNDPVQLPAAGGTAAAPATGGTGAPTALAEAAITESRAILKQGLDAFRNGKTVEATDLVFDAYLSFERIENAVINKNQELGQKLESNFNRLSAEIKRNAPLDLVEGVAAEIETDLDAAIGVLKEKVSFAGLFIQSFSIIVREGFEAILIIAALIAFLVKSRNEDKLKSIYIGVLAGIVGSFITAYVVQEVLHLSAASQEVMEGWIMLIAVVVLFWVSYWLVSKIEAEKWQSYITSKMKTAVSTGSAFTLGGVAFLSVYREGFETVLFYKALYLYAEGGTQGIIPGFIAGCAVLAVVYVLINRLGVRVPIKWFFGFTSVFLYFMAFVFMGKGLHELQMGKQLSLTPAAFVPEIPWMGVYPTWETFIGQMVLVAAFVFALVYTFVIKPEAQTRRLKEETSNIQKDIHVVHDMVEHISHHAKRCEIFLKDTKDQDLQELSGHLKEIDEKVHELFDHVSYVKNQLQDEYEKLGSAAYSSEEKKGLS